MSKIVMLFECERFLKGTLAVYGDSIMPRRKCSASLDRGVVNLPTSDFLDFLKVI